MRWKILGPSNVCADFSWRVLNKDRNEKKAVCRKANRFFYMRVSFVNAGVFATVPPAPEHQVVQVRINVMRGVPLWWKKENIIWTARLLFGWKAVNSNGDFCGKTTWKWNYAQNYSEKLHESTMKNDKERLKYENATDCAKKNRICVHLWKVRKKQAEIYRNCTLTCKTYTGILKPSNNRLRKRNAI